LKGCVLYVHAFVEENEQTHFTFTIDFRKVSKCYRGNALSPVVVHCSDGCGRTGSYMLLDLVIAQMVKGTCKEIDIAATLEHLRDQRAGRIVATKV